MFYIDKSKSKHKPTKYLRKYLKTKIYSKHDMIQTMTWVKKWERKIISHVGVEDIASNGKVIISIYICWGFNTKEIPYDSPSNEPF